MKLIDLYYLISNLYISIWLFTLDFSTLLILLFIIYVIIFSVVYFKYPEAFKQRSNPQRKSTNKTVSLNKKKNKAPKEYKTPLKYRPVKSLFTPTEQKFLSVLESIAGDELKVFGKIRISDIITPDVNKFEKGSGWHWLFSQISQKHVDFVITDNKLNLICAVELNDPSHEREDRKKRDRFVTNAFESANIPLIMINTQNQYLEQHIADTIAEQVFKKASL